MRCARRITARAAYDPTMPRAPSELSTTDIELRHLRAFSALARVRHFGRAAESLGIAQSTLSRTIAQLERIVGVPLLEASRTRIVLSPAGRALLGSADDALASMRRGVAAARRTTGWSLVLGLVDSLGYEWLAQVREQLAAAGEPTPELRPITLAEGFTPLSDIVDVGVYPLPLHRPDDLGIALLGSLRPWVALPADHPHAGRAEVRLADLRHEPAIAPPADDIWDRNVATLLRAHDLTLTLGDPASSMYEVLALVAAGRGWTLTASLRTFHPWPGVVFRPLTGIERTRIGAVWSAGHAHPERLEPLVAALRAAALQSPLDTDPA